MNKAYGTGGMDYGCRDDDPRHFAGRFPDAGPGGKQGGMDGRKPSTRAGRIIKNAAPLSGMHSKKTTHTMPARINNPAGQD